MSSKSPNSPTARTPSPKRDQHTDHCGLFQNFFNFFWTSGFLGKLGEHREVSGRGEAKRGKSINSRRGGSGTIQVKKSSAAKLELKRPDGKKSPL